MTDLAKISAMQQTEEHTMPSRRAIRTAIAVAATAALLGGCADRHYAGRDHTKEHLGLGLGAALGAVAGSFLGSGTGQLAAMAAGAIAGGALGGEIGNSLDRADAAYHRQATQQALESTRSGDTIAWRNPDSGVHGQIRPGPARLQGDRYCRSFTSRVWIDDRSVDAGGVACRDGDGRWQIVENR